MGSLGRRLARSLLRGQPGLSRPPGPRCYGSGETRPRPRPALGTPAHPSLALGTPRPSPCCPQPLPYPAPGGPSPHPRPAPGHPVPPPRPAPGSCPQPHPHPAPGAPVPGAPVPEAPVPVPILASTPCAPGLLSPSPPVPRSPSALSLRPRGIPPGRVSGSWGPLLLRGAGSHPPPQDGAKAGAGGSPGTILGLPRVLVSPGPGWGNPLSHPQGRSHTKLGHIQQHPGKWGKSWGLTPRPLGPSWPRSPGQEPKAWGWQGSSRLGVLPPSPFLSPLPCSPADRTRCPLGDFCPLLPTRLRQGQQRGDGVAATPDPAVPRCHGRWRCQTLPCQRCWTLPSHGAWFCSPPAEGCDQGATWCQGWCPAACGQGGAPEAGQERWHAGWHPQPRHRGTQQCGALSQSQS